MTASHSWLTSHHFEPLPDDVSMYRLRATGTLGTLNLFARLGEPVSEIVYRGRKLGIEVTQ